jgi:Rap1a immunity proteins
MGDTDWWSTSKRALHLLPAVAVLAVAPQALAGWSYLTGDALYAQCTSNEDWDRQACMSYIMGVSDGIDLVQGGYPNHAMVPLVCSPYLSGKDLKDIVVTHLKEPANRHYSAAEAVTFALENAWPCKKGP